jgi:hypothetical protein
MSMSVSRRETCGRIGVEQMPPMKRRVLAVALLLLPVVPAYADDISVSRMRWMTGCWTAIGGESGSGEQWMAPAGRSMLGMSRTVSDGETVASEFLLIAEDDEGRIALVALPSGQRPTTFVLLSQSDNEIVFENPEHDFPQRVLYRLMPGGILLGRIEGTLDGNARGVDFPMKKSDCETGDSP